MTESASIHVEVDGHIAHLRLSRPELLNALNFEMFEALGHAVDEVERSGARVCVVSGEGRSFCSGIDISDLGSRLGDPEEMIRTAQSGYRKLAALPFPTIAKVHGHALGAGLQLAIACDLRVVAADARLGLLEINYGIIPDLGGSTGLPRSIGRGRAKKMIWTGEQISGSEAERIGLAEVVADAERLDQCVTELAGAIAEAPPVPVREAKLLVDSAALLSVSAGFDAEAEAQTRCMTDPDLATAIADGVKRVMGRRTSS